MACYRLVRLHKFHFDISTILDIAIVSEEFGHDYIKEAVQLKLLALEINPDISPRPYSATDYKNSKPGDFLFDEKGVPRGRSS